MRGGGAGDSLREIRRTVCLAVADFEGTHSARFSKVNNKELERWTNRDTHLCQLSPGHATAQHAVDFSAESDDRLLVPPAYYQLSGRRSRLFEKKASK